MPYPKRANTAAKKRQFRHIEDSMLDRGATPKQAAMGANSQLKKHPSRKKK